MAQGTSGSFMDEKEVDEDSNEGGDAAQCTEKLWAGSCEVGDYPKESELWESNLQSAAAQLVGTAIRKEQQQWSFLVSKQISSSTADNRVNDNAALSVFPALQAQHGARERAYTGATSTPPRYTPHKSKVRMCLYVFAKECVLFAVT